MGPYSMPKKKGDRHWEFGLGSHYDRAGYFRTKKTVIIPNQPGMPLISETYRPITRTELDSALQVSVFC